MKHFITGMLVFVLPFIACAAEKKLKVYILAGQSNMEGQADLRVLDYMNENPDTRELYRKIKGTDGKYKVIENTWISFLTGERGSIEGKNREVHGRLTVGYGSQWGRDYSKPGEKIGPELAFGITLQEKYDQPVLIIKTAWGGQSLHTDFRSPSSGPFEAPNSKRETGARYRQMIEHVKHVLKDIKRVCPVYKGQGYELSGFVWFQGWNDLVAGNIYTDRDKEGGYSKYTEWLANFIRDVRKDLESPGLLFVIGVIGTGGPIELLNKREQRPHGNFRKAMAAPADMEEFKGNVFAVETALFWDRKLGAIDKKRGQIGNKAYCLKIKHHDHENANGKMSKEDIKKFIDKYTSELLSEEEIALEKRGKSNAPYHYLGAATTYSLIGQAFAKVLMENEK